MSKRKVQFAEGDVVCDEELEKVLQGEKESASDQAKRFKEKHSLDSDEEDNGDNYDVMEEDNIEGQEETGVDYEEGMRFTPFNMKDELEEGHFDTEGTYIFKKEKEIKDGWLDNIDWVKIKEKGEIKNPMQESDSEDEEPEKFDQVAVFKDMLELMKPGESVVKALKRLGGSQNSGSASQRWKKKKKGEEVDPVKEAEEKANKEKLLQLTGFADRLLQGGDLEIYQDTFEKLQFKVKIAEEKEKKAKTVVPEGVDDDDALDMFADSLDNKDGKSNEPKPGGSKEEDAKPEEKPEEKPKEEKPKESTVGPPEVQWEYKWKEEDTEIHGPFSSQDMADWQEDNYFKDGVLVRKVGTEPFYSSRRVDFELYT